MEALGARMTEATKRPPGRSNSASNGAGVSPAAAAAKARAVVSREPEADICARLPPITFLEFQSASAAGFASTTRPSCVRPRIASRVAHKMSADRLSPLTDLRPRAFSRKRSACSKTCPTPGVRAMVHAPGALSQALRE